MNPKSPGQYNEDFIIALQWMWGDGFLSPGGAEEVATMLAEVSVSECNVLDVGCGLGVIDVALVQQYGAASVVGVDVEAHLIAHCEERARKAGIAHRTQYKLIEPGPLPFDNGSFDMVFSKDAIVHMPDKSAFYAEAHRVLKPGGLFVGSDWLGGDETTFTDRAAQWLEFVHLNFRMQDMAHTQEAMEAAGFENVTMNDRNLWYQTAIKSELETLSGDKLAELAALIGQEEADYRLRSSQLKQQAIEDGYLRPTHFVARKPG